MVEDAIEPVTRATDLRGPAPPLSPHLRFGRLTLPDGAVLRHGCWSPAAPCASLVLLPGRSEFIEKYDEQARDWMARGFRVFALDWRGQGLSSRFLSGPEDGRKGHVSDYRILVADLDAFLERVVLPAAAGPLVLFAHSMGAHIAERHLYRSRPPYAAAILSAPMTDLVTAPFPRAAARAIAGTAVRLGFGTRYALGQGDYDPAVQFFESNPVTRDPARWAIHHRWFLHNPDMALGGVTYGWIDASFRSFAAVEREAVPACLPALVLSPLLDPLVPPQSHAGLCRRLGPGSTRIDFPDALHEVMMETDPIRARAWDAIDRFLPDFL